MYRTSAFFPLLRRFTALLLTAALLFLFLPPSPVTFAEGNTAELLSASGYDFTSNGYIAGKLQELFDLLPYSDYPYFTVTGNTSCGNNWCSSCMGANVARQHPNLKALGICDPHTCWSCFAFARYATLYIFGITADGLNYYGNVTPGGNLQRVGRIARSGIGNVDGAYDAYTRENLLSIIKKAAPGDIIQANGSAGSGNHTMIYLGHDDGGVFVLHDNMFKSNTGADGKPYGFNRVLVSKISYESMMSYWGNIISVLRVRQDAWSAAWNSSGSVCKTHTFTEAGGDRCTVCGYKFKAAHDPSAAGLYETVTVSTLRPSPYFSSGGSEIVQRGKRLAVAAALKNSIGETWYLLTNGEYTHGDNLKKTDAPADGAPEIAMVSYPSASHKKGSAFDLSGSITGKSALSEVCGMLISDDGSERQQVTVTPGSTRMDVYSSNINYSLKFGALKEGGWRFLLSAKDGEGRLSLFESRFTVGDGGGGYTPPAPGAPSLSGKTADSVTLVMVSGLEYRMEGGEWQKSNLFTGLSPATAYRFYARVAATENAPASLPGDALTVTTSGRSEIVLPPPVLASRTDSSVTLKAEDGFEYSMDGAVWQNDPVFTGLASRTAYFFYKRLKAEPSSVSTALAVTTDMPTPAPPLPPVLSFLGETELRFEENPLFEYSLDKKTWQPGGSFTGLSPGRLYTCYARLRATDTAYAGSASAGTEVRTDKHYPDAPTAPVLAEKQGGSVRLQSERGMEYSLDGEHFQASPLFEGLETSKIYTFYRRYAESETSYASETSEGLRIEILPGAMTSMLFTVDREKLTIGDIAPGTPLRAVISSLPEGDYVRIYTASGEQIGGGGSACTGQQLSICDGDRREVSYTLIVRGDLDGDGGTTVNDAALLTAALETAEGTASPPGSALSEPARSAADLTGDGKIDRLDLAALRSLILAE